MRTARLLSLSALVLSISVPCVALPHVHRGPTAPRMFKQRTPRGASARPAAVHNIDPERTVQIQSALIRAGYLSGTPSGTWDDETQAAMQKLQQDNHWQTKLVPDARAINKLGLGSGGSSTLDPLPSTVGAESALTTETIPVTNQ